MCHKIFLFLTKNLHSGHHLIQTLSQFLNHVLIKIHTGDKFKKTNPCRSCCAFWVYGLGTLFSLGRRVTANQYRWLPDRLYSIIKHFYPVRSALWSTSTGTSGHWMVWIWKQCYEFTVTRTETQINWNSQPSRTETCKTSKKQSSCSSGMWIF